MPKTVPLRQCIGCREQKPKTELIRVVRSPEGELSIERTTRIKSRALERALSVPVPEDVWAWLTAELEAGDG